MELEDLTKVELLKLIKEQFFYQPSPRDILKARWETLTEEANKMMAEANFESQKWLGKRDMESLRKWGEAQNRFTEGLSLSEKADVLFKQLCDTKD